MIHRRGQEVYLSLRRGLKVPEQEALSQIPGVQVESPRRVKAPVHAVPYLKKIFKVWGLRAKVKTKWIQGQVPNLNLRVLSDLTDLTVPGLREDKVQWFGYQQRELPGLLVRLGGLMQWAAGAGKTLSATAFAQCDTSPKPRTVVVTLSSTRQQWASTYQQFYKPEVGVGVQILDGFYSFAVVPRPKPRSIYRVEATGREPREYVHIFPVAAPPVTTGRSGRGRRLTKTQAALWAALRASPEALPLTNAAGRALVDKGYARTLVTQEKIPEAYTALAPHLPGRVKKLSPKLRELIRGGWICSDRIQDLARWKPFEVRNEQSRKVVSRWEGGEAPYPMTEHEIVLLNELCRSLRRGDDKFEISRARLMAQQGASVESIRQKYPQVLSGLLREWGRALAEQDARQRSDMYQYDPEIHTLILSWDVLAKRLPSLLRWGPTTVIFDESQKAKSTKVWEAYFVPGDGEKKYRPKRNMAGAAQVLAQSSIRVLLLSATPQEDRVRDWWAQLSLLAPTQWGTFHTFSTFFCDGHQGEYGWDSRGSSRLKTLNNFKRPWISRVTAEEARKELPPMRREFVRLRPQDLEPVAVSKSAWTQARASGSVGLLEMRLSLTARMKRPYVLERVVVSLADGHKVATFTGRKRDVEEFAVSAEERLYKPWIKAHAHAQEKDSREAPPLPPTVLWAHGESGGMVRAMADGTVERTDGLTVEQVRDLCVSETRCLLVGSLSAWSTGIDGLQCVGQIYVTMLARTPGMAEQFEGRFNRPTQPGQVPTPSVLTYVIAGGTVDDGILVQVLDKLAAVSETYEESGKDMDALRAVLAGDMTADSAAADWAQQLLSRYGDEEEESEWVDIDYSDD